MTIQIHVIEQGYAYIHAAMDQKLIPEKQFELQERNPSDEGSLEGDAPNSYRQETNSEAGMAHPESVFKRGNSCCMGLLRWLLCGCCKKAESGV
jgi:hypothetical protein